MTKADLIYLLRDLDDNAEICVTDEEQELCYNITEVRTTDGMKSYADIVIGV